MCLLDERRTRLVVTPQSLQAAINKGICRAHNFKKAVLIVVILCAYSDSAASRAGLTIGSCVLKVGEKEVVRMKHDEIVTAVMKTLEETVKTEGGRRVELKLSLPFMEHVGVYQYESIQNAPVDVYERNVESPYVFSIPAQVRLCVCVMYVCVFV